MAHLLLSIQISDRSIRWIEMEQNRRIEFSANAILLSLNDELSSLDFKSSCMAGPVLLNALKKITPHQMHRRSVRNLTVKYKDLDFSLSSVSQINTFLIEAMDLADVQLVVKEIQLDPSFYIPDNNFGAALIYLLTDIGSHLTHKALADWLEVNLESFKTLENLGAIFNVAKVARNFKLEQTLMEKCLGDNAKYFIEKKSDELRMPFLSKPWKPKISILCPTFNHEAYIGKTITSFFEQETNDPFEVIVADDASNDSTLEVLLNWKRQFPVNIKILHFNENIYQKWRRTTESLMAEASGDYIAFCDGDDFWLDPRKLKIQTDILDNDKSLISTTHNFFVFNESKLAVTEAYRPRGAVLEKADQLKTVDRLMWLNTIMFRRCFDRLPVEIHATRLGDQMLTAFLGNFGNNLHITDLFGSVQRQNRSSSWMPLSENEKNERRFVTKFAVLEMNKRLGNIEVLPKCEKILSNFKLSTERKIEIMSEAKKRISDAANFSPKDLKFSCL
jgi:glycosyltransferase involved in cell wall biosynthesis